MPNPLDPGQGFTVDVDEANTDLPDARHRRFAFTYGSSSYYMEVEDLLDNSTQLTARKVHDALVKRLADPADAQRLADELTPSEKVGLLVQLDLRQSLSEMQAKKSKPPSPSNTASSAPGVTPDPTAAAAK